MAMRGTRENRFGCASYPFIGFEHHQRRAASGGRNLLKAPMLLEGGMRGKIMVIKNLATLDLLRAFVRRVVRFQGLIVGVSLFTLVFAGGCAHSGSPRAATVANSIQMEQPQCSLERESHLALSGLSLSATKALVKLADEDEAAQILDGLKRVELATYLVAGGDQCRDLTDLGTVEAELFQQGWTLVVREQDAGEATWVFMSENESGTIDGLYVVTFDRRELEIVRLEGRIDEILAEAIAETPARAAEIVKADF
jgi:hypothetical protein